MEKIIKGDLKILNFLSKNGIPHPHGTLDEGRRKNNTIYIASKNLNFSDSVKDLMGYGRFKKTAQNLILTEPGKLDPDGSFRKSTFLIIKVYSVTG